MMNPWLAMPLVLATLGALIVGLYLLQRFAAPHPELVRKLLHMAMGLVTLFFPCMFDASWPVLVLAGLSIALLLALRFVQVLKSGIGNVVGGVARASLGEIYFPLAVAILFVLYEREDASDPRRRLVLYCIPILLLTLADAAAALIGISYGKLRYQTPGSEKSAEGSAAFFICAFLCVHIPLLLCTQTGRAESLLIGVLLAWLATLFEAIAWRGLDNLALPLVSFLLLKIYLKLPVGDLIERVCVICIMLVFLIFYRTRTTLIGSAVMGAFLVGYISWALGGWHWLLAPLIVFLTYTLLSPRTEENSRRTHNIYAVVCVASAGLIWLFLAVLIDSPEFIFPYTLAFAAQLAMMGLARLAYDYPKMPAVKLLSICIAKGWIFLFAPYLIAEGITPATIRNTLIALLGVTAAALVFYATQPGIRDCPADTPRWLRQAAGAGLGSAFALVPLYLM